MIKPIYEGQTAIIIGTGSSLTTDQIVTAKYYQDAGAVKLFGCNRAFEFALDVLHGCNYQFWDYYWPEIKDLRCDKWTTRPGLKYEGLNYIEERWIDGLSTDKSYIAAHHGTGPQLINIALHYGVKKMLLIGWDMRHSGKRHYFGEYPQALHHVTKNLGPDGELLGLIKEMETINPDDYGIEIINCTPNSALTHFPMGNLDDHI